MTRAAADAPDAGGASLPSGLWVPVAAAEDLGPDPLRVRAFGRPLALWRGEQGVQALVDRCPHRGARLSLGRVVPEGLQCGYHGWTFAGDGRCLSVPALPDFVPPEGHRAQAWSARERHGLVWVGESAREETLPALEDLPARRVMSGPFEVATSAPRVVENFLDVAHFAFVHPGTLGDPVQAAAPRHAVSFTADGRPEIATVRVWQPRALAAATAGGWVDYRYEVLGPYSALLAKRPADGLPGDAYALFALPVEETLTRVWFVQATTDEETPDARLQAFQADVFEQDRPVIESQRPRRLPLDRSAERHSAADRFTLAYRDWLRDRGVRFGTC